MAQYSVVTTKNNLASLIDKALAGEEVVITRHGKPTVYMRTVAEASRPRNADTLAAADAAAGNGNRLKRKL